MNMQERKQRVKSIKKFLSSSLFSPGFLEDTCNIPATTISQIKAGSRISMKPDQLQRLENYLKKYGLGK